MPNNLYNVRVFVSEKAHSQIQEMAMKFNISIEEVAVLTLKNVTKNKAAMSALSRYFRRKATIEGISYRGGNNPLMHEVDYCHSFTSEFWQAENQISKLSSALAMPYRDTILHTLEVCYGDSITNTNKLIG